MNIQDWFPLGRTGLISLRDKRAAFRIPRQHPLDRRAVCEIRCDVRDPPGPQERRLGWCERGLSGSWDGQSGGRPCGLPSVCSQGQAGPAPSVGLWVRAALGWVLVISQWPPLWAWERSYLLQPLFISLSVTINGSHCWGSSCLEGAAQLSILYLPNGAWCQLYSQYLTWCSQQPCGEAIIIIYSHVKDEETEIQRGYLFTVTQAQLGQFVSFSTRTLSQSIYMMTFLSIKWDLLYEICVQLEPVLKALGIW